MPHITICAKCGKLFEASSEETANEPPWTNPYARWCRECYLTAPHWLEVCLICGKTMADSLVAMQEHAMYAHGYSRDEIRNVTKRESEAGVFIWTMPDSVDWLRAIRINQQEPAAHEKPIAE